jgi:hypothetical protein
MPFSCHENQGEEWNSKTPRNNTWHSHTVTPESVGSIPTFDGHVNQYKLISIYISAVIIIEHGLNNVWMYSEKRDNECSHEFAPFKLSLLEHLLYPPEHPANQSQYEW